MPRPRSPDIEHVPPTAEEVEADLDVFCTQCQVAWSPSFADRRTGLCVNHLRAQYRAEHVRRGARGDLHALTAAEAHDALVAQDGKCPVCKAPITLGATATAVADYDANSKRFRAFTCLPCRKALRLLGESPERAEAAAKHLRRKPSGRSAKLDADAVIRVLVTRDETGAPRPTIGYEVLQANGSSSAVFKSKAILPVIEGLMATQATPRDQRTRVVAELRAKDTFTYGEVHDLIERLLSGTSLTTT